jgi:UDP-N-acetylmuramoylalanine--D-glutamate ligase
MTGMELEGRRAGVMGLGISGEAAARFLAQAGATVIAADARQEAAAGPVADELREAGISIAAGEDEQLFEGCDLVIISPGVPPDSAPVRAARARGTRVLSEIELAGRVLQGRIAGITGSNGKSTVTAMTSAILTESGLKARPCGNIGLPLISMADRTPRTVHVKDLDRDETTGGDAPGVIYVTEISSFQLEATESFRPEVAALLNLSPDHQDRYESDDAYYAAKARIFLNQGPSDTAVINADDPRTWALAATLRARLVSFSLGAGGGEGVRLRDGAFVHVRGASETWLMSAADAPLPGRHNLENVAASAAIAIALGAQPAAVARAVTSFTALPHRLRPVGRAHGVRFFDDSKATNVGAAMRAVESFEAPVILLLGGRDKGGDFRGLARQAASRVKRIVTFGEAGPAIAAAVGDEIPVLLCGSMEDATRGALDGAAPGDVILLAPACASFDAYAGYAARGRAFEATVRQIERAEGSD